ncbi:MAG TPA: shikimate dehydrogenase [Anaerolineales bacterium]|nr:shikimate dehydrogenase [Anaerolineales bacterium]
MIRLGLTGYPLGHSLSPRIHEAALRACGLDGNYSLFPISPDDKQGLEELLARVRSGEITGLNVTIPHKQSVIRFLDELTPTAKAIGAVNTIYMRENRLIGENTDAPGFLADLKRSLTTETQRHKESNALVLGAGGSARAVVYALLEEGWKVTIAARRLDQAKQLADSFTNYRAASRSDHLPPTICEPTNLQSLISSLSLIVNTTPVGMIPNIDQSPWPENLPFPPRAAIYDLVYNPPETRLVREARAQGLPATTGLGMLIEQAALAFEIWTGHRPSREVLFTSATQSPREASNL